VTYTGTGSNTTISHSLGSVPACIMVKRTDTTANWQVYHRSLANTEYLVLNTTAAKATGATRWNSTTPTSSVFSLGTDATVNASGGTYVAYIFADDAGGFGLTGTDNVISCGSFTTDASGDATINLGWEPQWVLTKYSSTSGTDWIICDNMRPFTTSAATTAKLFANTSGAETVDSGVATPFATGFKTGGVAVNAPCIYIAIRRGPMKVPTDPTKVFAVTTFTGVDTAQTAGFPVDFVAGSANLSSVIASTWIDRLRGITQKLETPNNNAEGVESGGFFDSNTQVRLTSSGNNHKRLYPMFRRAPSFMDIVCYTGTGSARTVSHNLQAVPELMIVKSRSNADFWRAYSSTTGNTKILILSTDDASLTSTSTWNSTTPTSSVFTLGTDGQANGSGKTFVNYLFSTCPGVSKVGSFTGNGTTQTINCGFTGGAKFVLIKRTDALGDWYAYDTARGMTVLTDPYLWLNSTAAEVATLGSVTTVTTGFALNSTILAAINVNAGTYIFLAIA